MGSRKLINLLIQFESFYSAIPNSLWRNANVPICAVRTWCYLYDKASDRALIPWPSYKDIADTLQFTRRTAITAVNWLQENGYLVTEKSNEHTSNDYLLVCPALLEWCRESHHPVKSILLGSEKDFTTASEENFTQTIEPTIEPITNYKSVDSATLRERQISALPEDQDIVPLPEDDLDFEMWQSWPEAKRRKWGQQFMPSIFGVYWEEHRAAFGEAPKFSQDSKKLNGKSLAGVIARRLGTATPADIKTAFRYAFATDDHFISSQKGNPLALLSDGVFNDLSLKAQEWDAQDR